MPSLNTRHCYRRRCGRQSGGKEPLPAQVRGPEKVAPMEVAAG